MPALFLQTRAARFSSQSQANGALMRVAPLAVWGHRLSPAELADHAAADARLSHPNQACCDASAAYSIAVAHLIAHPGDAAGALQAACAWVEDHAGEQGLASRAAGSASAQQSVLLLITYLWDSTVPAPPAAP